MKRILICTTILSTINAFLVPHIRLLQELGYSVDIAGRKDTHELDRIADNVFDLPFQRTPFSRLNLIASYQLSRLVRKKKYDIIHFHTPIASAFGRWVVRKHRFSGTKVYYTAHGFHFHSGAPITNWLIYYPVERYLSRFTDTLITINKEDYTRAQSFNSSRVVYVPGVGLDTTKFSAMGKENNRIRETYGIPRNAIVALSVGELNENKNHEIIVKAVAQLDNPDLYYIICGNGPKESYISELAERLGVSGKVKLLGFRNDIDDVCRAADLFVFPSFREGLGLAAIEAMASGLPIITSNIHGIADYSFNGVTGYNYRPDDLNGFLTGIRLLIDDNDKRNRMGENNKRAAKAYDLANVLERMRELYETQ